MYRWSGTEYLPGPRVLDFRATAADGVVSTVATDVDSVTFSNAFDVGVNAAVSLNDSTLAGYPLSGTPAPGRVAEFIPTGGNYPAVGGFAVENLGSVTHTDNYSWPEGTAVVQGESDIVYTPGGGGAGSGLNQVNGAFSHSRTDPIDLTNARIDVEIDITSIDGSSGDTNPALVVFNSTALFFASTTAQTMTATLNLSDTEASGNVSWPSTRDLDIQIQEVTDSDVPFTYTINYVRLSFTQTEFDRGGSVTWVDNVATDDSITTACLLYTSPSPRDS